VRLKSTEEGNMIKFVEDVVPIGVVAAADIITVEKQPSWNRPLGIGLAAAGYLLGGLMGIGGGFLKNLGIASGAWGIGSIYEYIKEASAPVSRQALQQRLQMQPASRAHSTITRYPARETKEQFQDTRLIG
jgi:hypothetical protein